MPKKAAFAVATGAIGAAYDISDVAGDPVRNATTGTIDGVRVVAPTAISGQQVNETDE